MVQILQYLQKLQNHIQNYQVSLSIKDKLLFFFILFIVEILIILLLDLGTIYTAAKEIEELGGKALPILCDIRFEKDVAKAIELTVKTFGGIDILVNNASAISLTDTVTTDMKK